MYASVNDYARTITAMLLQSGTAKPRYEAKTSVKLKRTELNGECNLKEVPRVGLYLRTIFIKRFLGAKRLVVVYERERAFVRNNLKDLKGEPHNNTSAASE